MTMIKNSTLVPLKEDKNSIISNRKFNIIKKESVLNHSVSVAMA